MDITGKQKIDIQSLLARLPLFSAVPAVSLEVVAQACTERSLARGEMLFAQGDPCRGMHMVLSGQIKLAVCAPNGNEKVVELVPAMRSLGEAVMFLGRPYPVFAQALVDSRVLHVPSAPLLALLDTDVGLARRMLAGLSQRLHSLVLDVESYALRSSAQRLIGYLLRDLDEKGLHTDMQEVELPTSKQVLASRLSVTPETFSRVLHALSEAELIEVKGKTILLRDIQKLRDFEA